MSKRDEILKKLLKGGALPAGPAVLARVAEICRNPNATARDLGKVLQLDPALTTRVLKQVNSSFYGLSATIKTVTHAVVILGFDEIKHVVMAVPVANLFEESMRSKGIDIAALWDKTVEIACLARALSYQIRHPVPEQVFVAAILSNTGMVVLNNLLGEEYAALSAKAMGDNELLLVEEEKELGLTHAEVGRMLAESWHFPPDLVQTIASHYNPVVDGEVLVDAALLCTARKLRKITAGGEEPQLLLESLPPEIVSALNVDGEMLAQAFEKGSGEYETAKTMLGSA